jgi:hypothetical protein
MRAIEKLVNELGDNGGQTLLLPANDVKLADQGGI